MKNIEQILETPAVFMGSFKSIIDIVSQFENIYISTDEFLNETSEWAVADRTRVNSLLESKYKDTNIIFANYETPSYEGYAYILFEKDGKLYEVDAGHCSCYGLEDQWEPEEVDMAELEHRLLEGTFGESSYSGNFKKELCEKLGVEYKANRGGFFND